MKYSQLLKAVKTILFNEWDPIGVNDSPLCCDEYDSYAPAICRMLRRGADTPKLARHLSQLQQISIGLSEVDEERDRRVASSLIGLVQQAK